MIDLRKKEGWVLALVVSVLLSGCSSGNTEDLQAYVDEVKKSKKGRIEPLPDFKTTESFEYSAGKLSDPFVSWQAKAVQGSKTEVRASNNGLRPDMKRRREPLESYPLDALLMVGTLVRKEESSALIRSPDGLVTRVAKGNYVGQNHGKIVAIRENKIELMEIVPDGLGGWLRRPASLALVE